MTQRKSLSQLVQISYSLDTKLGGPVQVVSNSHHYLEAKYGARLVVFGVNNFELSNTSCIPTLFGNKYGLPSNLFNQKELDVIRQADVLLMHGHYQINNFICLIMNRNATLFIMPHGSFEKYQQKFSKFRKAIFDILFKRFTKNRELYFFVATEEEKQGVLSRFSSSKVFSVGLGIHVPKMVNEKSANKRLITLSRLHPKKNIELCIDSMKILNRQNSGFQLQIAGSGRRSYEEFLKRKVISSNLEDSIDFCGELIGQEKEIFFSKGGIFLLPSFNENFAIAVAECISQGIPVIVSRQVGLASFVESRECGIVLEIPTAQSLVDAILEIEGNYSEYSSRCISVRNDLDWEKIMVDWCDALERLIS